MMGPPFFRVEHLSRRFGGLLAVNDVTFELRRDQIVGLIGPNGAGKTTAFNVITRLYTPDSGDIRFDGESLLRTGAGDPISRAAEHAKAWTPSRDGAQKAGQLVFRSLP